MVRTLAENNDTVKRDIIKKVIETKKKVEAKENTPKPPMRINSKKEEGYSKLKVAIKEDVLKMSCA